MAGITSLRSSSVFLLWMNHKENTGMQLQPTPTFVSVPEFAARTSLSVRQVWRLISHHDLPTLRVGRRRLIRLDEGVRALEDIGSSQAKSNFMANSSEELPAMNQPPIPSKKEGKFQVHPPFANDPLPVFGRIFRKMSRDGSLKGPPGQALFAIKFDNDLEMTVREGDDESFRRGYSGIPFERKYANSTDYFLALADLFECAQRNGKGPELLNGLEDLTTRLGDLNE